MSLHTLLVLLDQDPLCGSRVDLTLTLARRLDAHVIGLAPTGVIDVPATLEGAMALGYYAEQAWTLLREQAEAAAESFRQRCRSEGFRRFESLVASADRLSSLLQHAHCSDALVLSQPAPGRPGYLSARGFTEQVVLQSARPSLLVPHAFHPFSVGRRVVVAWDDRRESARALSDGLPLLRQADSVHVFRWLDPSVDGAFAAERAPMDRLHAWLGRHGVAAEMHLETADLPVAQALLSRCTDVDADLVVMGAYGHARWAERLLGGATDGMLSTMTVPVLMSH